MQLYSTAGPQLIYSWMGERVEELNSIHGHVSRIKSDYTRIEKTANIISEGFFSHRKQHPAILPFWVIGLK